MVRREQESKGSCVVLGVSGNLEGEGGAGRWEEKEAQGQCWRNLGSGIPTDLGRTPKSTHGLCNLEQVH